MKGIGITIIFALLFVACSKSDDNTPTPDPDKPVIKTDSVTMGAGYANDIYFSLSDGIISQPARTQWDIAFYTKTMASTIITNDGNGVKLYVWPNGDINDWDKVDTTGIAQWTILYNSYNDTTWENGAFDKNALGHPDYGWGIYNDLTHTVTGDSVHIIVFADGSAKKLIIETREASTHAYKIKFADIDGNNETTATIPTDGHTDKNFVYFSIANNQVVDHEPASAKWDLLFTKYYDETIPYTVSGVLINNGVMASEVAHTDTSSNDYATASYVKNIDVIGADWKTFNMETLTYDITPNLVYFVKDKNGNYHKLVFTAFDYTQGKFVFTHTIY